MKRLRPFLPVSGIFCFALLVRVIYNNVVAHSYIPTRDSLAYQTIAFNLLKQHCFCQYPFITTVYRAPLWPGIIAAISLVMGPSDTYARLFLCVVGSGTCVLIYLFARDLFGSRIGTLAGIVAALYPELYIYDGWLYTESLYIFLLLAFCYGVYTLQHSPRGSKYIWCGILLGLLALTRPNGLIVLGLFLGWVVVMGWVKILSWREVVKGVVVVTLIALAIVAPWTIRNYNVSHAFIPIATGDGTVLLGAYNDQALTNPQYLGSWINPLKSAPAVTKPYPISTCDAVCEVAREDAYKSAAQQWIQAHVGSMPYLLTLHFLNMWQPATHETDLPTERFPDRKASKIVLAMMETVPIPVFLLAALGFVVTLRKWRELLFLYGIVVLTIAECLVFYGSARLRAPIEPLLILLAAGAIWWLMQREEWKIICSTLSHCQK